MKLYYATGACSLSPHIVLRELGLEFELEKVDLKNRKTESGDNWDEVNPKGYVPALEIGDDDVISEGPAILAYLTSRKPGALTPEVGSRDYFHYLEWVTFINSEIHKGFGPLFSNDTPEAREKLGKKLDLAARLLGDRTYLAGDSFSAADAYLFTVLRWADHFKLELPATLLAFRQRIEKRPKVQAALQAEGLLVAA